MPEFERQTHRAVVVVEGACRHLVKDRMELSGMRWTVAGAEALAQRAVNENGVGKRFITFGASDATSNSMANRSTRRGLIQSNDSRSTRFSHTLKITPAPRSTSTGWAN